MNSVMRLPSYSHLLALPAGPDLLLRLLERASLPLARWPHSGSLATIYFRILSIKERSVEGDSEGKYDAMMPKPSRNNKSQEAE